MDSQQGWTPDYPEGDTRAGSGRGGKRAADKTPGSTPRSQQQGGPPPAKGRKAPRGLDQEFGQADPGEAPQRQTEATVLDADLFEQTYLEVYPSKLATNPPPREMSYVSPGKVMHEIRLKGMANGVHQSKFARYGATDVKGMIGHYFVVVDDAADGAEIVRALGGLIRIYPDVPKDSTKRYDSFEYEYIVKVHDESEGGAAGRPNKLPPRADSDELSVQVDLKCPFHYQFDKTHLALPWEQMGWQVMHVRFVKVKVDGCYTGDRAPSAILRVRPPLQFNNELNPGSYTMEAAGRNAILPRYLHLEIPFENQPPKELEAEYFIYDRQSNPPCDLERCFLCHRPNIFGCAIDCGKRRGERRQMAAENKKKSKEMKSKYAHLAEQARNTTPHRVCLDFKWGLCTTQTIDDRCAKGMHVGIPGPCNIGAPKGEMRKYYAGLDPPWKFCKQGPNCVFDHAKWGPDNMKKTLKKRDEELGASSGQGPSGMDTDGCDIITHIRTNKHCKYTLDNYTFPSQAGAGGVRMRREHEREPGRKRGNSSCYINECYPGMTRGIGRVKRPSSMRYDMIAHSNYTSGNKGGGNNKIIRPTYILTQGQEPGRKSPLMCRRNQFRPRPPRGGQEISSREREGGESQGKSNRSRKGTKEAVLSRLRPIYPMCRRRHFRLRPGMWNIQRRKGPTISPRERERGDCERGSESSSEGRRLLCETGRFRLNYNIGYYEKYITCIRGGARDINMAEASRRLTAGERATSSHKRRYRRHISGRTMGCVQGRTPRIKCTGKTKGKSKTYIRDLSLLAAPTTSGGNGVGGGGRGAGAGVARLAPALVNRAVHQCKRRNPKA